MDSSKIDFRKASKQQLCIILADDPMARPEDILAVIAELERRRKKRYGRTQYKIKPAYGRSS